MMDCLRMDDILCLDPNQAGGAEARRTVAVAIGP
jgi:hypothetical protein